MKLKLKMKKNLLNCTNLEINTYVAILQHTSLEVPHPNVLPDVIDSKTNFGVTVFDSNGINIAVVDYCKDPRDAMPIILDHNFTMIYGYDSPKKWSVGYDHFYFHVDGQATDDRFTPKYFSNMNLYKAAMVCYLELHRDLS